MKKDSKIQVLTNYSEFEKIVSTSPQEKREQKIKENAEYIEYIKEHDKVAYKNYLSYSTYLKV